MLDAIAEAKESNRQKEVVAGYRTRLIVCAFVAVLLSPLVIGLIYGWVLKLTGYDSSSILDEPISNRATYRNPAVW